MVRPVDWAPLAPADPVPGDPWEVALLARRYRDTARAIADQTALLNRLGGQSPEAWDSDAGLVFAEHARSLAEDLGKAEQRYAVAALALEEWVPALEETQTRADHELALAKEAQARLESAAAAGGPPGPGAAQYAPGTDARAVQLAVQDAESAIAAAKRRLEAVVDDYHQASARLAYRIKEAAGHDGLKDSKWDKFKNWVADHANVLKFISKVATNIALALSVAAFALCWVPVLGQALLALTALATAVALVSHTILALGEQGGWGAVALDLVALASFGSASLILRPLGKFAKFVRPGRVAAEGGAAAEPVVARYTDEILRRGVDSPRNGAVFHNGSSVGAAIDKAEAAAATKGGTIFENTPGGLFLQEQKFSLHSEYSTLFVDDAMDIQQAGRRAFAERASGDVEAFVEPRVGANYFQEVQLPILREGLNDGRITSITVHDLGSGATTVERYRLAPGQIAGASVATQAGDAAALTADRQVQHQN